MNRLGLVGACLAVLAASSHAATYVIAPDGTGDFPTIQAALDAVVDGDVIELTNGFFTGDGNRDVIIKGVDLTIRSQSGDYEQCVIDLQGSETDPHFGFVVFGGFGPPVSFALEDLTIQNGWASQAALEVGDAEVYVRRCRFASNHGGSGGAIVASVATMEIYDSIFIGNSARNGGAVFTGSMLGPLFVRCTFAGNRAERDGGAIYSGDGSGPRLVQCVVWGNCANRGHDIFTFLSVVAAECSIIDETGLYEFGGGSFDFDDDTISVDPLFCNPASCEEAPTLAGDYEVADASPCLPTHSACGQPIGALGMGCAAVPVEATTWGGIKARYR